MSKNKINSAMFFVLLAGLIWSFGPLVVRNMDNAELVPWQYSLIRGSAIFIILNLYLFLTEGSKFTNNYNKIGLSGIIGGISLGIANLTFILSLTSVSYTHLRAHETEADLVCRLLLEKKKESPQE